MEWGKKSTLRSGDERQFCGRGYFGRTKGYASLFGEPFDPVDVSREEQNGNYNVLLAYARADCNADAEKRLPLKHSVDP